MIYTHVLKRGALGVRSPSTQPAETESQFFLVCFSVTLFCITSLGRHYTENEICGPRYRPKEAAHFPLGGQLRTHEQDLLLRPVYGSVSSH